MFSAVTTVSLTSSRLRPLYVWLGGAAVKQWLEGERVCGVHRHCPGTEYSRSERSRAREYTMVGLLAGVRDCERSERKPHMYVWGASDAGGVWACDDDSPQAHKTERYWLSVP